MLDLPMIIDCFAGGGGASTGIEHALGRSPDVAINHDEKALALHAANHPETLHLDSNIWDVEPAIVAKGRKIGLLWASPDCKHFSKAKGGKPKDRNIRDLAWAVVRWAKLPKHQRPDVILMENVEEFRTWGPICDDGKVIKGLEGVTFDAWVKALRELGYKLDWKELRGCDYGAPTIRKRFFMVARCDGRRIVWPKPTHGKPSSAAVRAGRAKPYAWDIDKHEVDPAIFSEAETSGLKPWRTAAECIDYSLPCPSILDSKETIKEMFGLTAKRPLAENTLARIARGVKRYLIDEADPFILNLTHGGRIEDPNQPIKTITGANRGEKALVAPSITRFNGGATGQDMRDPLATITANSYIKRPGGAAPIGMITPHLLSLKGTRRRDFSVTAPHPTVLAGGLHSALVAPTLIRHFGNSVGQSATSPAPTTTAGGGGKTGIVSPILTYAQQGGRNRDALDPMHTICASRKDQNAVIAPFLAQHNTARKGHNPGRPMDAPISAITASGSQQQIVAPWFAKYYGTGEGAMQNEPCHTITARDRFGHVQANLTPTFGPEHEYRAWVIARFLQAHDAWDDRMFVTLEIDGETYVIVDIGMRMLTPRELFTAQGFPPDYVIEGVWNHDAETDDWTFEEFSKSVQVSCCGNSVCPDLSEALAWANCQHLVADGHQRKAA